jgi:hypothetical protein
VPAAGYADAIRTGFLSGRSEDTGLDVCVAAWNKIIAGYSDNHGHSSPGLVTDPTDGLKREAHPVFQGTTVIVITLVCLWRKELA